MNKNMTGAELVAAFIAKKCFPRVFLVTGGACAFNIDEIGRNEEIDYVCVQHEQAAAMAADAIWRTCSEIGVTVATSGPGATNLITGIASSWFDSIPSIHITGQVNQAESSEKIGANVRQAGFQETDIVEMVKPITKYAVKVKSTRELAEALRSAIQVALDGRMGPVLIDIPMDIQQAVCSPEDISLALGSLSKDDHHPKSKEVAQEINDEIGLFLRESERPLVLIGAGLAFGRQVGAVQSWCEEFGIPYCVSWGGLPFIDRSAKLFQGSIGVYGSRLANWAIQSADRILVFGSRLDNRQRTGNPDAFAPFAKFLVIDVDGEELAKYKRQENFSVHQFNLSNALEILPVVIDTEKKKTWLETLAEASSTMDSGFGAAVASGELSPYEVIPYIQQLLDERAIVIADTGANVCWVHQSFLPSKQLLFTAGGNSPMGYSLPAAIGAKIAQPDRQVVCFIGDGGFQMNIQELQTVKHYGLDIKIVILNNSGYGIIKQFQDAYFDSRYEATGRGYSVPDFGSITMGYGLQYRKIENIEDLESTMSLNGACVIDVILPQNTQITPKVEMNRFIHDQFPYGSFESRLPTVFSYPSAPSELRV